MFMWVCRQYRRKILKHPREYRILETPQTTSNKSGLLPMKKYCLGDCLLRHEQYSHQRSDLLWQYKIMRAPLTTCHLAARVHIAMKCDTRSSLTCDITLETLLNPLGAFRVIPPSQRRNTVCSDSPPEASTKKRNSSDTRHCLHH